MRIVRLIAKEIRHRAGNFSLSVLGVAAAVAGVVALVTLHGALERETRRTQRDIGFNLRIIPADADLDDFLVRDYSQTTMPLEVARTLANHETLSYNQLVATLQQEIELGGGPALVTGIAPTMFPPGQKRPPMSPTIESGTVHLGHHVAARLKAHKGGDITIRGREFEVARVAPPAGNRDDLRVWVNLIDAQDILDLEGQINEIQAMECLCLTPDENPRELLSKEISRISNGQAKVVMLEQIATARARQRQMIARHAAVEIPALVVMGALWVGVLSLLNVRHRRQELGILRAVGYGSGSIASLVMGKAVVIGVLGAAIGFGVGAGFAQLAGPRLFELTGQKIAPRYELLGWTLVLGPMLAAAASFVPATLAVTQDPAVTLRED